MVDYELHYWAGHGGISPYNSDLINPASIDLRLGEKWIDMLTGVEHTGEVELIPGWMYAIGTDSYKLEALFPGWQINVPANRLISSAILATTQEYIRLDPDMAGSIKLKTTPCRKGLGHPIADWVDPEFHGELTMMLYSLKPITLTPGMRIAQLVIWHINTPAKTYKQTGHYYGQSGPTGAWDERIA